MQLGKYQLVRRLAVGGMAEVFLAKALGPMGFEKLVVVKRVLPHLAEEPRYIEMFLAEAQLVARLNHPGVVQVFDFGTHDGRPFFALEFLSGGSLTAKLNGTPLPAKEAARLVESIARAVQACASKRRVCSPATSCCERPSRSR